MAEAPLYVSPEDLRQFVRRLFEGAGVGAGEAERVAESLVDSDLCGHDSHGVVRVSEYVGQLRSGEFLRS